MKRKASISFSIICLSIQFLYGQTLKDAQKLTDNEQYDVAASVYSDLLKKEPNNGTYWFYYGENFLKWDNEDSARICYEKGMQVEPNNPLNLVGHGKLSLNAGKTDDAKKDFDKALTMAKANISLAQSEIAEAYIFSKYKDPNYAVRLLQNAIGVDPNNAELYILMGDAYSEMNSGTTAAENYNKALDLDKNAVRAIVHKGVLYKRSTNFDGAAEEFRNAIKLNPDFAPAYRELGEVYFRQRKLEDAKTQYQKYLVLSKNGSTARLRYATFLFISKDYQGAMGELNQLSKLDSNYLPLVQMKAYTYFELGDFINAEEFLGKVFKMQTEDKLKPRDWEYKGKIQSKNGQDSLALISLEKAYSLDSSNTDLLNDIGTLYSKMKKYPEAARAYQLRIDYGKNLTTQDFYNLGKAYMMSKNYTQADSAFAKVNEVSPTWPMGYLQRAKVNTYIDTTSKNGLAKPHYEKYISLITADSTLVTKNKAGLIESYKYLGYYYFLQKDMSQSKDIWKKILELDPADKQAKDVLEGMKQEKK